MLKKIVKSIWLIFLGMLGIFAIICLIGAFL